MFFSKTYIKRTVLGAGQTCSTAINAVRCMKGDGAVFCLHTRA